VDIGAAELTPRRRFNYDNFVARVEYCRESSALSSQAAWRIALDLAVERIAPAVHYLIANTQPGQLGYVKLNKILWYSDLEHYRWHGVTITGLRQYSRTPQGPISPYISHTVARLVKRARVALRAVNIGGCTRQQMICLEPPDLSALTKKQIDILDSTAKFIAPLSAGRLRQMMLDDALWQELCNDEMMPIATASVMTPPLPI
jgi:hypothetical protein